MQILEFISLFFEDIGKNGGIIAFLYLTLAGMIPKGLLIFIVTTAIITSALECLS